jgi:hypothetical protein
LAPHFMQSTVTGADLLADGDAPLTPWRWR